jgi:indolepyruvate ferredoxin oxidoreductase
MAAHLDGKRCTILDMTGMAQKGGSVTSHIRICRDSAGMFTSRLSDGMTDLLIAADAMAASAPPVLRTLHPTRTTAVLNTDVASNGDFQSNSTLRIDQPAMRAAVAQAMDSRQIYDVAASTLATQLTGDSIGTNIFMLGYAVQRGLLPVSVASIAQAIRLNGTFVAGNLRTLALGRLAAHAPDVLSQELGAQGEETPLQTVDEVVTSRTRLLEQYQDARYANRYRDFVGSVRARIAARGLQASDAFTREVALTLGRLMAYKDEYEVARMYTNAAFMRRIREQFDGKFSMTFHLAPPLLPGHDSSGRPRKRAFGSWILVLFRLLASLRRLRGSRFDVFGYTHERKMERRLVADYQALINEVVDHLTPENLAVAMELARAAGQVAGYGPVKLASINTYESRVKDLRAVFWR